MMVTNTKDLTTTIRKITTEPKHAETQCKTSSFQILNSLMLLIGSFTEDDDLEAFSKVDLFFLPAGAMQDEIANRKHVREKILPHVFDAVPDKVEALLKQGSTIPSMLLTKAGS